MWIRQQGMIMLVVAAAFLTFGCGGGGEEKKASTPPPAAVTPPPEPATPASAPSVSVEEGKKLFQQTCAACHGMEGEGMPNLGKDMTASAFIKQQSDEELIAFIKQGRLPGDPANTTGVAMPPKGGNPALQDAQLHAIVAYIRTLMQ